MKHILVSGLLALCCTAQAQQTPPEVEQHQRQELRRGDPARWSQADRNEAQQLATLRKEIGAALAEARAECKRLDAAERGACLKEAQATYAADLGNMRQQLANANGPRQGEFQSSGE